MKLSFSIKGWDQYSWDAFCALAKEMDIQGIELRDIRNTAFTEKGGPFDPNTAAATLREMYANKLQIPCIDSICDISDAEQYTHNCEEITAYIKTAASFKIPYVRVHATADGEVTDTVIKCLQTAVAAAEEAGVTILIETVGMFADTGKLRNVLNSFASDYLGALWDMQHPYHCLLYTSRCV